MRMNDDCHLGYLDSKNTDFLAFSGYRMCALRANSFSSLPDGPLVWPNVAVSAVISIPLTT